MFKKLLNEISRLDGAQIRIPITPDDEGYLDKECPNPECLFQFKVKEEDWESSIAVNVFCPQCRHKAPNDSWFTTQQVNNARQQAKQYVHSRINKALREGAQDFNRKQPRNSFLKMRMTVQSIRPHYYFLPISAMKEMQQKVSCTSCSSKYAVIGSAFFCPFCGHNSAEETFDNSIKKIRDKLKSLPFIVKTLQKEMDNDVAKNTQVSLLESSINECVVAFQRFCEVTFNKYYPSVSVRFNAFQKLDLGGSYWHAQFGETYSDWLDTNEYSRLIIYFQRRHLLSHTEGMVDQKYIDRSGDLSYQVGQRIVVKESEVEDFTKLIEKIVLKIRSSV